MRHPNGYGTVAKLSGSRRNPYVVRKTKGWDARGYPIYEIIGYFPTREAGLIALAQYNNSPWNVSQEKTTLEELFKLWEEKKGIKLGHCNLLSLKSAFKHCANLNKMKYKEIRAYQMQECIDTCNRGYSTQAAIKNLFGHLDKFALELDLINRCYSDLVTSASVPETTKEPFTEEEISRLWKISNEPWVDSVLIFLYTGFRISELLDIRTENVDLEAMTIKGGTKTKAGKDRIVPIHPLIASFVRKRMEKGGDYLFNTEGKQVMKRQYYVLWSGIMNRINAHHTVHETRHTFRSRLDSVGANKRCIDLLMGHKSLDVGERVYTHKTVQELRNALELITH
ncbi:hypothetical protein FACS1894105_08720 [Clostridia bacterium]|nr:hypothetical protein FACS1894105_08720 [Clostridia bacterium]